MCFISQDTAGHAKKVLAFRGTGGRNGGHGYYIQRDIAPEQPLALRYQHGRMVEGPGVHFECAEIADGPGHAELGGDHRSMYYPFGQPDKFNRQHALRQ